MDIFDAMNKTMDEYKRITGLRSYLILDTTEVKSASERNYFWQGKQMKNAFILVMRASSNGQFL